MTQVKVSQKLLNNLIKYKINPHDILKVTSKFQEFDNKINITYITPYLENKYLMTSSGNFNRYQEISYKEKVLEINYNFFKLEQGECKKNKILRDVEFLKIWGIHVKNI
jgi:hypothetical protein